MRSFSQDGAWGGEGESPRRSRVTRLVDLLDGCERRETPSPASAVAPRAEGRSGGVGHPRAEGGSRRTSEGGVSAPTILSVAPEGEGETIVVVMVVPPGAAEEVPGVENSRRGGQCARRVKLHLLVEQYAELRAEGISLECGDIAEEHVARLMEAGALCSAICRGMAALQYGDRSARRLAAGLAAKGIDRETAEAAAAYLARKGYIREEDTAGRRVSADLRKGWGPRRIREDLRALGLEASAIDGAMEALSEVDFDEACAAVIRKKYGEIPKECGDRQKMTAALMRLGYDLEHVRGAMRLLTREST